MYKINTVQSKKFYSRLVEFYYESVYKTCFYVKSPHEALWLQRVSFSVKFKMENAKANNVTAVGVSLSWSLRLLKVLFTEIMCNMYIMHNTPSDDRFVPVIV